MPIEYYSISELFPQQRSISKKAKPSTISISDAFGSAELPDDEDDFVKNEQSTLARISKMPAVKAVGNAYGRFISGLAEAELSAETVLGKATGLMSDETFKEKTELRKRIGAKKQELFPYSKASRKAEAEGEWYKSPAWLAEHGLDVGADLLMAAGFSVVGTPAAGMAYMGGKAGATSAGAAMDRLRDKGYDDRTAAQIAAGEGAVVGLVAAVTERLPLGFLKSKPALKKTLYGLAAQKAARIGGVAVGEAIEEVAEGTANDFTQWLAENDPDAFKDFWKNRAKEAVLGSLAGGVIGGGKVGGEIAFADTDLHKIDTFAAQLESIMQKPGGVEKLAKLSAIANPTRKDFKDTGFRINLNADQRSVLAESLRETLPETLTVEDPRSKTVVTGPAGIISNVPFVAKPGPSKVFYPPAAAVEPAPAAAVEPAAATPEPTPVKAVEPASKLGGIPLSQWDPKAQARYREREFRHASERITAEKAAAALKSAAASPTPAAAIEPMPVAAVDRDAAIIDKVQADFAAEEAKSKARKKAKKTKVDPLVAAKKKPPSERTEQEKRAIYLANVRAEFEEHKRQKKARGGARTLEEEQRDEEEAVIDYLIAQEQKQAPPAAKKKRPVKTPLLPPLVTEEEGFLDIGALARVATGGSVQGAKAIVGGRLGRLIGKGWRVVTGQVRSRGNLEKGSFAALEKRNFRIKTEMKMVDFAVQRFRKAAHKAYGMPLLGDLDADTKDTIRSVLRGEESIDTLPAEVREPVRAMRKHVDALSREGLNSGAFEGRLGIEIPGSVITKTQLYDDIREAIQSGEPKAFENAVVELVSYGVPEDRAATLVKIIANDGVYLTTAYDAFRDPNYSERMPQETFNDFVNWWRGEHPDWTEVDARNDANRILLEAKKAGSPLEFLARGFIPAKDLDGLRHKKNLPEVWRKFLGEREDPILNYLDSVQRIAQLNATHQMYTEMRADGLAKGYLFDPTEGKPPEGMYAQIAAPTNEGRYPLSGLVTYPEVAEAFAASDKTNMDASWYKALMFASSVSELGKTAGSPMATIRQLPSNMLSELSNGHNPLEFATMIGVAWTNLFNTDNSANQEYLLKAISRGVVGENLDLGTIEDRATQGLLSEAIRELTGGKFQTGLRKLISLPSRLYGTMDDIFKLANWEATMRDFRKAYPEWTEEQLMDEAAKVTRNTTTMYSRIPPVLRSLKRSPLGNFISFESEQIRNQWYRAGYTIKWLADPRTRFMGAKLAAGQIAARAIPLSLAALSRFLTHTSKEEEEALRGHVPWWSRYATLIHLGTDDEGIRSYADMSFTDPLSFAVESANAATRGDIWGALGAFFSSYGEPKILFKALDEARQGETYEKRTIYNQQDDELMKFWLGVQHVMNTALEPGIVTSGKRIARGIRPTSEEEGKRYKLKNEVAALTTGVRLTAVDPRQSTSFKASRFQNEMSETNGIFNSVANRTGAVSQSELASAYERTERNRREAFDVMAKNVQGTLTLLKGYNFDEKDAQKILEDNGIAKAMTAALLKNEYQPYIPSSLTSLDKMLQVATPEHKNLLEAKRDDVIGTMVQTASRPVETEKTRVTVENALAELDANGVGIQQGIESLWRKLLADDQESENEKAEKRGGIPRRRVAPRNTISRRRSLQRLGADQETINRFFATE